MNEQEPMSWLCAGAGCTESAPGCAAHSGEASWRVEGGRVHLSATDGSWTHPEGSAQHDDQRLALASESVRPPADRIRIVLARGNRVHDLMVQRTREGCMSDVYGMSTRCTRAKYPPFAFPFG